MKWKKILQTRHSHTVANLDTYRGEWPRARYFAHKNRGFISWILQFCVMSARCAAHWNWCTIYLLENISNNKQMIHILKKLISIVKKLYKIEKKWSHSPKIIRLGYTSFQSWAVLWQFMLFCVFRSLCIHFFHARNKLCI